MLYSLALHDFPTAHSLCRNVINFTKLFLLLHVEKSNLRCLFFCLKFLFIKKRRKCYCWLQFVTQTTKNAHSCIDDYSLGLINKSNFTYCLFVNVTWYKRHFAFPWREKWPLPFSFSFGGGWKTWFLGGGQKSYCTLREVVQFRSCSFPLNELRPTANY